MASTALSLTEVMGCGFLVNRIIVVDNRLSIMFLFEEGFDCFQPGSGCNFFWLIG